MCLFQTFYSVYLSHQLFLHSRQQNDPLLPVDQPFVVIVVVHRKEIERQWVETIEERLPGIASVQVLSSTTPIEPSEFAMKFLVINVCNMDKRWSPKASMACSVMLMDEAHCYVTDKAIGSVLSIRPRYLLALTATPDRSDGRGQVLDLIAGDRIVRSLYRLFHVYYYETPWKCRVVIQPSTGKLDWGAILEAQALSERRNKLICDFVSMYWNCNRTVLVLCKRVDQAHLLHQMLETHRKAFIASEVLVGGKKIASNGKPEEERPRVLITTYSKCLAPDTPILMWNGEIKCAADVRQGDQLIGDDGLPRNVLSTCSGEDEMYRVRQSNGDSYVVNSAHILTVRLASMHKSVVWREEHQWWTLTYLNREPYINVETQLFPVSVYRSREAALEALNRVKDSIPEDDIADINITDFLAIQNKHLLRGFKANMVHWPAQSVPIDPWALGAWLSKTPSSQTEWHSELESLGLLENKHIPQCYLANSREVRLQLLAGIIDAIGNYRRKLNFYSIVQRDERLMKDIVYLAKSLGFITKVILIGGTYTNGLSEITGSSYFCHFKGKHLADIPIRILRNRAEESNESDVDALSSGICVDPIGRGPYSGFTLDGNGRFLLGDFTVTHNSGTGFSDARLDTLVLAADVEENITQFAGRVFRRSDVCPTIIDLVDKSVPGMRKHFKSRTSAYEQMGGYVIPFREVHDCETLPIDMNWD